LIINVRKTLFSPINIQREDRKK